MTEWKCAGCGSPEPFLCGCQTGIAYSDKETAWKRDVIKMNDVSTQIRFWLFRKISDMAWVMCPEPHRTRLQHGIGSWDDVNERIKSWEDGE